jgi:DNA-binding GntR family transcriptional regulator
MFNNKEQFVTTKLEVVYNVLRENIVNGNLEPGARLVIKKIAQDLGVSDIPVREAIRMLEAQGLVTMTPHAGAQVSKFNIDDIQEIVAVRGLLEGYASRTAIPFIQGQVLDELNACLDEMKKCVEEGNLSDFGALNRKFHQIIYDQSPIKRLNKMISEMWDGSERTRAVFGLSKQRPKDSLKEHQDILAAILEGDGDKVERLVREHRRRIGEILINHLKAVEAKADHGVDLVNYKL